MCTVCREGQHQFDPDMQRPTVRLDSDPRLRSLMVGSEVAAVRRCKNGSGVACRRWTVKANGSQESQRELVWMSVVDIVVETATRMRTS